MSDTINAGETVELPSAGEIEQHMNELEQRGIPAEIPCRECGTMVEMKVPPEAKGDENQRTLCRSCITEYLQNVGKL